MDNRTLLSMVDYLRDRMRLFEERGELGDFIYVLLASTGADNTNLKGDIDADAEALTQSFITFLGVEEDVLIPYWPVVVHRSLIVAILLRDVINPSIEKKKKKILSQAQEWFCGEEGEFNCFGLCNEFKETLKFNWSSENREKGLLKKVWRRLPSAMAEIAPIYKTMEGFEDESEGGFENVESDLEFSLADQLDSLLNKIAEDIALSRYFQNDKPHLQNQLTELWETIATQATTQGFDKPLRTRLVSNGMLEDCRSLTDVDPRTDFLEWLADHLEDEEVLDPNAQSRLERELVFCAADTFIESSKILPLIDEHRQKLEIKKSQLVYKGHYGELEEGKWLKEIDYFVERVALPKLSEHVEILTPIKPLLEKHINLYRNLYETRISNLCRSLIVSNIKYIENAGIGDGYNADFDGFEYEAFVMGLFSETDIDAKQTSLSGDFGLDVICHKGANSIGLQCKHYSSPIGVSAVQEAFSGKGYYDCKLAVVVSNAGFTPAARIMSDKLGVLLSHHDEVVKLVKGGFYPVSTDGFKKAVNLRS